MSCLYKSVPPGHLRWVRRSPEAEWFTSGTSWCVTCATLNLLLTGRTKSHFHSHSSGWFKFTIFIDSSRPTCVKFSFLHSPPCAKKKYPRRILQEWHTQWRRNWQPTLVFLPGKSHGQRSLVGYSPWDHKESDTTERLKQQTCLMYRFEEKLPALKRLQVESVIRAWIIREWKLESGATLLNQLDVPYVNI